MEEVSYQQESPPADAKNITQQVINLDIVQIKTTMTKLCVLIQYTQAEPSHYTRKAFPQEINCSALGVLGY